MTISLVTYTCDDSDNRSYRHCLLHLGALGPVARMRLRLVPHYHVQVYAFRGNSLPYLIEHFLELATGCHSFTLGLNFATGECTTWLRHKFHPPAGECETPVPVPAPLRVQPCSALLSCAKFFFMSLALKPREVCVVCINVYMCPSPMSSENYKNRRMARCVDMVHGQVNGPNTITLVWCGGIILCCASRLE